MSLIITHERIALATGLLTGLTVGGNTGLLYGNNALQSVTIARHTPKNPVQAIGHLGIVDYTAGTITSSATLDAILVEGCNKADTVGSRNGSYRYAGLEAVTGAESYVLTSAGIQFPANAPASVNFGWMTSGLASYLDTLNPTQAAAEPVETGTDSSYAVVMGDDGAGIQLIPTWSGIAPPSTTNLPVLDVNGNLLLESDQGLPAGVQSVGFNSSINRDQILDMRSTSPVQFVTTYPVDVRAQMEVHILPVASGVARAGDVGYVGATFKHALRQLQTLTVSATALGKELTGTTTAYASNGDAYCKGTGFVMTEETEGVSVGRYLTYNFTFLLADLILPLP